MITETTGRPTSGAKSKPEAGFVSGVRLTGCYRSKGVHRDEESPMIEAPPETPPFSPDPPASNGRESKSRGIVCLPHYPRGAGVAFYDAAPPRPLYRGHEEERPNGVPLT